VGKKLVYEEIIPKEVGRGVIVRKGQVLRIIAIDGPQVSDLTFINLYDHSDSYDAVVSYNANAIMEVGNYHKPKYMYSRMPNANLMAEVTDDKIGRHWWINGGHCSNGSVYTRRQRPSARSCHGNVAEVIADYGMTIHQVPNTFPLWMCVTDEPDGEYLIYPSLSKKGDHIDFLAHMDLLVPISSCPGEDPDAYPNWPLNDGVNRALKAEIYEDTDRS